MVCEREAQALDQWLLSCETASIPELANFAAGLRQDYSSVHAALSLPWSNGQTEGQVNRLKLIKRQLIVWMAPFSFTSGSVSGTIATF